MGTGYKYVYGMRGRARANQRTGRCLEHIAVMEEKLGRQLGPSETVHHINCLRWDNRPENLELWSSTHPAGARVSDLIAWAKEILVRYPDEAERI